MLDISSPYEIIGMDGFYGEHLSTGKPIYQQNGCTFVGYSFQNTFDLKGPLGPYVAAQKGEPAWILTTPIGLRGDDLLQGIVCSDVFLEKLRSCANKEFSVDGALATDEKEIAGNKFTLTLAPGASIGGVLLDYASFFQERAESALRNGAVHDAAGMLEQCLLCNTRVVPFEHRMAAQNQSLFRSYRLLKAIVDDESGMMRLAERRRRFEYIKQQAPDALKSLYPGFADWKEFARAVAEKRQALRARVRPRAMSSP